MSENKTEKQEFILWRAVGVLEKLFCTIPVIVMTALVFTAVICRYVFKSPIGWSEEVTLVCMTWCVFGAASYAFHIGINVGVTFLVGHIGGKKGAHLVNAVIHLVTIVFFVILGYVSLQLLLANMTKYTLAAHIPLYIPYSAMPTGCVMCVLRLIESLLGELDAFKKGEE